MVRRHGWLMVRPLAALLSKVNLVRGRVLDIGIGAGLVARELAIRHPGWEIWGVDRADEMLEHARANLEEGGVGDRVHLVHGDATQLPFPMGTFDLAFSQFTLPWIDRPEAAFDEAARVVRGGGRIFFKELVRPRRWRAALLCAYARQVMGYTPVQLADYQEALGGSLSLHEARAALNNSRLSMAEVRPIRGGLEFVITH